MEPNNNPRKAGALILNNIDMFNEAAILLEQHVEKKIFEELQKATQDWVEENGWVGGMDWVDDEENLWVAPKSWMPPNFEEGDYPEVFFYFEYEDETYSYNVADLCGCGQTRMGFCFSRNDKLKKKIFKDLCKSIPTESLQKLESLGFKYDAGKPRWFLPVTLDNNTLASAYENDDYDNVMEPLLRALETIREALPIFNGIADTLLRKSLCSNESDDE